MAKSGSFATSYYLHLCMMVSWSIKSQSIENNTTTISWSLKGLRNDTAVGYITCGGFKVIINGVTVYSKSEDYRVDVYNGTVVASGETTISHNADGTKSFSASVEAAIYYHSVNVSGSGSFTLDTIPRATTPTVSGTLSLGSTITISTAGRASSKFTHILYYSWGSQVIDALISSGVTTSKSWTIPKTLAEHVQGGTSGTMFLKCVTYNGSTEIGTKIIQLIISIPDTAEFRPSISSVSTAEANALPVARYVVGKTQLTVNVTAVGAYVSGSGNRNSFISKAVVTVDGVNYNVTLGQNAASTWSVKTNVLVSAGSKTGTVTVTDSRGRSVSKNFTFVVYDYSVPVISSFTANRCLANGTLDDSGTYILFGMKTTVASIDGQNAKTYKIVYENSGAEVTLVSGTLSQYADNVLSYNSYTKGVTFSVDKSWKVRLYVYDSFNSNTPAAVTVLVPTESTFMDWRENGKGMALGMVSTHDGFQCGWTMYDKFDALIGNGLAAYGGSGNSAIDPNTTLEHLIVTNKNTPTTAFWYVQTLFYSKKSDSANRTQIAYMYNSENSIYTRYYKDGWSAWREIPMLVEAGTSGIWNYKKMANGEVELWGTHSISNLACSTALGNMYRTDVFSPSSFPFTVLDPKAVFNYESEGYGAFPWATTVTTTEKPPSFYLIRPTSTTIASGKLNIQVIGRWK